MRSGGAARATRHATVARRARGQRAAPGRAPACGVDGGPRRRRHEAPTLAAARAALPGARERPPSTVPSATSSPRTGASLNRLWPARTVIRSSIEHVAVLVVAGQDGEQPDDLAGRRAQPRERAPGVLVQPLADGGEIDVRRGTASPRDRRAPAARRVRPGRARSGRDRRRRRMPAARSVRSGRPTSQRPTPARVPAPPPAQGRTRRCTDRGASSARGHRRSVRPPPRRARRGRTRAGRPPSPPARSRPRARPTPDPSPSSRPSQSIVRARRIAPPRGSQSSGPASRASARWRSPAAATTSAATPAARSRAASPSTSPPSRSAPSCPSSGSPARSDQASQPARACTAARSAPASRAGGGSRARRPADWPAPGTERSSTTTSAPRRASASAAASPTIPPPTTATSGPRASSRSSSASSWARSSSGSRSPNWA